MRATRSAISATPTSARTRRNLLAEFRNIARPASDPQIMLIMSRERIRALYLHPAPLFGGAERQAAYAASLWPEFGVDVLPMVGPGQAVVDWLRQRGVKEFA